MASKQTQETTKTIRGASGGEAQMNRLFAQIAQQAGGNLGSLADLDLTPNSQDQALVDQSIGASSDIARRELEKTLQQIMAQQSESLAARGIQGSSIESMMAGQVGSEGLRQFANQLSGQQQQGAQALMNLPFQRGQMELGRNQALMQRLTSLGGAVQQGGLQERLNTIGSTTTQTQQPGMAELMQLGASVGGMATGNPFAALGGMFGGGGQPAPFSNGGIPYRTQ